MRILYATDGSEGALAAARLLAGLPHHRDIHVHIVTACDSDDPHSGRTLLTAAQAALGDFPGHFTTAATRADTTSEIVESLLWSANYLEVDLIVLGASGHSAVARFFLGSVSEAVARHAKVPVLLARPGGLPLQEVIIGVDGSADSRAAADFITCAFPLPDACSLRLVQAVPLPVWPGFSDPMLASTGGIAVEEATEAAKQKAQSSLTELARELRDEGRDVPVQVQVGVGSPAAVLLDAAEAHYAGLVVVGSHGLTGVERFLLGSVSERVMRHAPCSVLVVKRSQDDQETL